MDAFNSIASAATAASKAIWGDNQGKDNETNNKPKEEPLSGVQGDTSKGEPFDAGNMSGPTDGVQSASGALPSPADHTHKDRPSSNMPGDSTLAQNDTRKPSDEKTSPGQEAQMSDASNVEMLDPKSLEHPGPRALDQVAKEHGGDAGATGRDAIDAGANQKEDVPGPGGNKDEERAGAPSENEGAGEKYTQSTGLMADGGDFDAANPGAGREAGRLLERKGIHVGQAETQADKPLSHAKTTSGDSKSSSPERKGVKGLGQKIKAKLRRSSNA